ncbi:hypothetical protein STEG23_007593 [Scotinomys teguina]
MEPIHPQPIPFKKRRRYEKPTAVVSGKVQGSPPDTTPVDMPAEPVDMSAEPVDMPAEPVDMPAEPVDMPAEPVDMPADPVLGSLSEEHCQWKTSLDHTVRPFLNTNIKSFFRKFSILLKCPLLDY